MDVSCQFSNSCYDIFIRLEVMIQYMSFHMRCCPILALEVFNLSIVLQLVGIAGSIFGLYGYYTSNMTFMVAGLVVAFLFCKMNQVSIVEHILARITVIPLLSLPGMFICHFAAKMTWGDGLPSLFQLGACHYRRYLPVCRH